MVNNKPLIKEIERYGFKYEGFDGDNYTFKKCKEIEMTTWHTYNNPDLDRPCCGNCIHVYDEAIITACMIHDWMPTTFENTCSEFNNGKGDINEVL